MKCTYTYKGKKFDSVEALNDFILSKKKFESQYGDMVFQLSTSQLETRNIIEEHLAKVDDLRLKYDEAKNNSSHIENGKRVWNTNDGEMLFKMTRPYVGVSEFLKGQRNREGKLYFPEFDSGEYWSRRYLDWDKGNFTEDEINLFFDGDSSRAIAIPAIDHETWRDANGKIKDEDNFGSDDEKKLRKMMEEKWSAQAEEGTAIHDVLQRFFSQTNNSRGGNPVFWYDLLTDENTSIRALHETRFVSLMKTKTGLKEEHIREVLDYARELKTEIQARYGKGCTFYPEITLSAKLNKTFEGNDNLEILGRLDLLVVDENGYPQIIDYKTSPRPYDKYSSSKKLGFTYQLGTYERMLRRLGLNTMNTDVMVAPIQMENFHKDGDKWVFDHITKGTTDIVSGSTTARSSLLTSLNERLTEDWLNKNMDEYLEAPMVINGNAQDTIQRVVEGEKKWFGKLGGTRVRDIEEVKELINAQLGENWLNKNTNSYIFTPPGNAKPIEVINTGPDAEAEFFKEVSQWYQRKKDALIKTTGTIISKLKEGLKSNSADIGITDSWLRSRLSRYCSDDWEIYDEIQDVAQLFGMIVMRNKTTKLVDVVKISYNNPWRVINWGDSRHTNLIGAHESDDIENAKSDSLMLKAANGNIDMIEAMLVLNACKYNSPVQIGKISVISYLGNKKGESTGLEASNKELMYCWNRLNQIAPLEENNFGKNINMISKIEQVAREFDYVIKRISQSNNRYLINNFSKCQNALTLLHGIIGPGQFNVDIAKEAITELMQVMESEETFNMKVDLDNQGKSIHTQRGDYDTLYAAELYRMLNSAYLELNKTDMRQELKPGDPYIESFDIMNNGISGLMIDNANNFSNRTVNLISLLALDGVQNAREIGTAKIRTLRDKVEQLKKDTGYNSFLEHTIGNLTSLYEGMTFYSPEGNLLFSNPWDDNDVRVREMSPKLKEFLKYVILEINKSRYPDLSENQILEKIVSRDEQFFQVPLIKASFASEVDTDGWLGWLKNRFRIFKRGKESIKEALVDLQSEYLSDDIEKDNHNKNRRIFDAVNMMDQGNDADRLTNINKLTSKYGQGYFERDLERILGTHIWAYATHDAFQERMPLIKAAYISVAMMGNSLNKDYKDELEFIENFVRNKINKESITDPRLKALKGATNTLQSFVSWMALAFSPVQFTYQSLEGIWKDAKLIFTNYDGQESFTFENMKKAAGIVYRELGHTSDKATVVQMLNAYYGLNDMDAASFVENNSSNNHGIFNFFGKFAYKFSSRPDFYNRMTIFVSLMLKDGSWEAHSIKDGLLYYDWTKDKRFEAFAHPENHTKEEYNEARARYYATAQQLIREGARNADGTLFRIGNDKHPTPLPKAYSNKESEAKKAVGDTMYGYYDSTKKSMMLATYLGSLLMQMRTYWSGKKNQYFAPGGFKAQGRWVVAKDPEGNELYFAQDEDGNVDYNAPLVTKDDPKCSGAKFLQWKGKFEEGVMVTFWDIIKNCKSDNPLSALNPLAWRSEYLRRIKDESIDEDLRKTWETNMKLLRMDLLMLVLLGFLANMAIAASKEISTEAKGSGDFGAACVASLANIGAKSLYNSTLDFNWIKSIFEISADWNPFAIMYATREIATIGQVITGDKTFEQGIVNSFSATRQFRPMFEYLL